MRRGIKKIRSLKVRRFAARLIDMNEYLDSFAGATLADKIYVTELIVSMPNSWSKHAQV